MAKSIWEGLKLISEIIFNFQEPSAGHLHLPPDRYLLVHVGQRCVPGSPHPHSHDVIKRHRCREFNRFLFFLCIFLKIKHQNKVVAYDNIGPGFESGRRYFLCETVKRRKLISARLLRLPSWWPHCWHGYARVFEVWAENMGGQGGKFGNLHV